DQMQLTTAARYCQLIMKEHKEGKDFKEIDLLARQSERHARIGVEGATTDGRNIERAWLEQMAASYDPQVYTALINLEHIKG
ncbi:GPO family capsid scaffolding protein, partial [Klebsiella pneumoniae]|uniref:GPO family capsid scaffolding protein n=1 Tax=Klebsiella pneumoniae TaxID=573 RepID=UPI003EE1A202